MTFRSKFMPTWERTIEIEATPGRVWLVMADVGRWPEWTASIVSVEPPAGGMALGAVANVHALGTPKSAFTVTGWRPGAGFTWETKVRGMRSVAGHEIKELGDGRCRARLTIEVQGLVATVLKPLIRKRIVMNLDMEAEGLKRESEATAP